jgi:CheY-like chemotaxis protein
VKVAVQPGTAAVLTDPRLLESALINLVVNARDAMPHGGTLTVTVGNEAGEPADNATAPTGLVAFAVRDSGCGMSPDVLARATDPFFTTKAAGAGTGLGLAMVRSLAEQSGGTLRFASRPGAGTVVTLALPAAGVPQPDMAAAPAAADAAVRDDGTILLVDDDGELRGVMAECLEDLGWTVIEAGNGVDALAAVAAADRLDLVIADVAMPSMDGLTLSLRLRTTRPGLPVLFMSGDADMAELAPGEVLLPKPFTTAGLTDAIARKLGRPPASTAPLSGNAAFNETAPIDAPRRDALLERLRDPRLRAALQAWLAAGTSDRLPPPEAVDPAAFDATDHAALIAVDPTADPVEFRFVRAGRSLEARLGRSLAGERLQAFADEALGSLPGAAVRCARTLQPGYERARFDLGDGIPSGLERLLLPLSADGAGVTHLLSVAIFEPELEPLHHARPRSAHL